MTLRHGSERGHTVNYFTCTLDEAVHMNNPAAGSLATINDFIDFQAETKPHNFAVGFPLRQGSDEDWSRELFSWSQRMLSSHV